VSGNVWIVSSPPAGDGIGSRLLHLSEAVWLARSSGCPVVVDWRGSAFLKDPSLDYFTELFVPAPELLGARMHHVPSPEVDGWASAGEDERLELSPAALERLLAEPPPSPRYLFTRDSLRLERTRGHAKGYRAFLPELYRRITPRPEVTEQLEAWYEAELRGRFVVGVNVSTGNGLFAPGARLESHVDMDVFEDEERFLRAIERACERATAALSAARKRDYRMFFATDSAAMSELLLRLPQAVTRRTVFPPPGSGHAFNDYDTLGYSDRAAAIDTIVDMLLLARCDALVRNNSRFSLYARVLTGNFGGNVQRFEKLYRRADEAQPA
jgi:hypothetical protein